MNSEELIKINSMIIEASAKENVIPLVDGKRYEKGYRHGVLHGIIQVRDYLSSIQVKDFLEKKGDGHSEEKNKKNESNKQKQSVKVIKNKKRK